MDTVYGASKRESRLLSGIRESLRRRGTPVQKALCLLLMLGLTGARLPLGGYCCQLAMFAVLLRLGFCVPAAFAGMAAGFALSYAAGALDACWQLPCGAALWLLCGLWSGRGSRVGMTSAVAAGVFLCCAAKGIDTPLQAIGAAFSALAGAGLCLLYDGAALTVCHRDELDGDTRPLCVLAVCASLAAGLHAMPAGRSAALALGAYLTLEHAYTGGGPQAILRAGVLGTVLSFCEGRADPLAMLMAGGFLAGEIRSRYRMVSALLMAIGMAAAGAVLGGEMAQIRLLLFALTGFAPFLMLSPLVRLPVTSLIERSEPQEMTQSEAVAVRCASMIHAWARLYEDTAQMMQGLSAPQENEVIAQCVQLLRRTSAAAHQVCERTLSEVRPDDAAYRRVRYALVHEGLDHVRAAYALRMGERMEVLLLKPEADSPAAMEALVSRACGIPMRACSREGLLSTQALYEQVPLLTLEIGAATRSRSGEEVTGDSYISRALPGGRHIMALSDGMGSGHSALEESHAALALLVESLRAGYTRAQALDVVNALMLMCTGREMYATMDLCVCDLHTGETAFEKLGACASYVVREGEVRAIGADTLPVGVLENVEAQSLRMTLRAQDTVVMLTDGVRDAYPGGEEALREAIGKLCWLHPQAIGEKLIAQALASGPARDDMCVLCARVRRTMIE